MKAIPSNSYAALGRQLPQPRLEVMPRGAITAVANVPPRTVNSGVQNYHEALRNTPDRTPLPLASLDFRSVIRGLNREKLSALGRYLYDNDGRVSYAIDTSANYVAPVVPQAASPNPEWNRLANAFFDDWAEVADFTGRFDLWWMQRLMFIASKTDGDQGALMTEENGLPQIQLVDGWRIRNRNASIANQNDGVIVDEKGRVKGFWLDQPNGAVPIPSNEMFLFGEPSIYSEYRSLSPLRRGSNDVRDKNDIKAFEKIATKIGSALSAVIETEGGALEEDVWGNDTGDADGESPGNHPPDDATQQEKKLSIAELLGGDIPVLGEGEKLHQIENKRPGTGVPDFLNFLVGEFVCGLGLPPAFYLDEKLTGPNQRAVNGKAQRHFDKCQERLARFVHWVWKRVISWAIATGRLPAQEGFLVIEWNGPARLSIDGGEDRSQERDDVESGLMTRQQHFSNRNLNHERETDQWFAERERIVTRAKEISERLKVPIELCMPKLGSEKIQQPAQEKQQPPKQEAKP